MKSQRIGYAPSKTSFKSPDKSKGFVLENVVIGVLGITFGALAAYGMVKVADSFIEDYRDHKTSTVHNSAGVVIDKDGYGVENVFRQISSLKAVGALYIVLQLFQ